jgi:hypothetical protein
MPISGYPRGHNVKWVTRCRTHWDDLIRGGLRHYVEVPFVIFPAQGFVHNVNSIQTGGLLLGCSDRFGLHRD